MENSEKNVVSAADLALIEAAIAQAKSRRGRPPLSAEERAERQAKIVADREARRAAKEAKRAATPAKKPAHTAKLERAQAALPALSAAAQEAFLSCISTLSQVDQQALAAHLQHQVRAVRTLKATVSPVELEVGERVRVSGGDPRFVGLVGTVAKAQRIRCYVDVPGQAKPLYLFTSDVERLPETEAVAPAAPAGEEPASEPVAE